MATSQTLTKRDRTVTGVETDEIFAGRYRILNVIGAGGVGTVYRALDVRLDYVVAIKMFPRHFATDSTYIERFKREARAMARLSHPGIVKLYDVGEVDGQIYIVMEYVEGQSLAKVIASHQPLDVDYAIAIVHKLGETLGDIHRAGIIHRDLKPSNILISPNGRVALADFGLSMPTHATSLTDVGTVMGTPQYMSPEQVKGERLDARSDLFSLGVVFYELLTGRKPFSGEGIFEYFNKIVNEQPLPPRSFNPAVSPEIEKIVLKTLAKKPEERYHNVDAFIAALEREMNAHAPAPRSAPGAPLVVPRPVTTVEPAASKIEKMPVSRAAKLSASKWAVVIAAAATVLAIIFQQGDAVLTKGSNFFLTLLVSVGILASFYLLCFFIVAKYRRKNFRRPRPIIKATPPPPAVSSKPAPSIADPTVETLPFTESPIPHTALLQGEPHAATWLLVLNGPYRGQQFRLAEYTSIGRSPACDVVLNDHSVSSQHASVRLENGRFYVYDLGSRNGTYANGVPVKKHELRDRDEIRVGNLIMIFVQVAGPNDLAVDAKRRQREFDSLWKSLHESITHD